VPDLDAEARIDQALIARVLANNDENAFAELVRRHQGMVRAQLRSLLPRDHAGADDIAQETFLLHGESCISFAGMPGSLPGSTASHTPAFFSPCAGGAPHASARQRKPSSQVPRLHLPWSLKSISTAPWGNSLRVSSE